MASRSAPTKTSRRSPTPSPATTRVSTARGGREDFVREVERFVANADQSGAALRYHLRRMSPERRERISAGLTNAA
jgi:hypothetical protein